MARLCGIGLALLWVVLPLAAAASQPVRHVVVLPFTVAKGIDEKSGRLLDEVLLTELSNAAPKDVRVVGASDVQAVLGFEQQKQLASCDQTSCLVEIGNALGASHVVVSSLGMFGKQFIISSKFLDVRDASVLWRKVIYTAATEEALLGGVRQMTRDLVAAQGWSQGADASAATAAAGASAVTGGAGAGIRPLVLVGGGVGAVGLLAAVGFGVGALLFDSQVGAADATWEKRDQAAQLEAGMLAGAGLGGLALIGGGIAAGIGMVGE
jgi:hypothetical protein